MNADSCIQTADSWRPLEQAFGRELCKDFMWMGRCGTIQLYKHVDTRQYLNIDAVTGGFYDNRGKLVSRETAIADALS